MISKVPSGTLTFLLGKGGGQAPWFVLGAEFRHPFLGQQRSLRASAPSSSGEGREAETEVEAAGANWRTPGCRTPQRPEALTSSPAAIQRLSLHVKAGAEGAVTHLDASEASGTQHIPKPDLHPQTGPDLPLLSLPSSKRHHYGLSGSD